MRHLDLFSGIGGFALAADWVWPDVEHIFCEIDDFCQDVLEKHWPDAPIYGDIRELTHERYTRDFGDPGTIDLLTGGFPCQPFSAAGRRRGTKDDRYLWSEMLRVIREFRPRWVIGENVRGLLTQERGMVFEGICTDLEGLLYEVQPFIIPACAVDAPHRRDRVWIVAHTENLGDFGTPSSLQKTQRRPQRLSLPQPQDPVGLHDTADPTSYHGKRCLAQSQHSVLQTGADAFSGAWEARQSFLPEAVLCRTDDGIPNRVDRTHALGNAIVPQVAVEILQAIKSCS